MELSLVSLDSLLGELPKGNAAPVQLAPNVTFRPLGALRFLPSPQSLIGRDGINGEALEQLRGNRQQASRLPTGLFELTDVILAPPHGLIIDPAHRTSYFGRCIGWNGRDFGSVAGQLPGATITPGMLHLADGDHSGFHDLDEALMAAAPHYEGYGHWLLDFLPRLHVAREQQHSGLPVYRDPELAWARQLCHLAGFSHLLPATGTGGAWYRVKRLIVPSFFRVLDEGDPGALLPAFSMLERALDQQAGRLRGRRVVPTCSTSRGGIGPILATAAVWSTLNASKRYSPAGGSRSFTRNP